jgi:UDP-N-acetylmuramate--alanine ligase
MAVATSLDHLAEVVAQASRPGDLVLAMGAGDVNGLWDRLNRLAPAASGSTPVAA